MMALAIAPPLQPDQLQAIARAIGEPRRFAIFQQIAGAPSLLCCDLEMQEHLSPATISHHLKELQEAGLISTEREGRVARLSVRRDVWKAYLEALSAL